MSTAREEGAIARTFTAYAQTFQSLDPDATLGYCHVPCMFISPRGARHGHRRRRRNPIRAGHGQPLRAA